MRGDAIVERARRLIGVRFRPQGRDARFGLDCVGLLIAAYGLPPAEFPSNYRLRGDHRGPLAAALRRRFRRVSRPATRAGDLMCLNGGPGQLHLALASDRGLIHADAGIGRVVERPSPSPWPVLAVYRLRRRPLKEA